MSTETTNPTTPAHRIFVGNLTQNIESAELEKAFAEFGKVLSVRVIKKKFQNNTFGFVDMEDLEAANKAVAAVNGKEFDGKAVTVEIARERSTEDKSRKQTQRRTRAPRRNNKPSGEKKEGDATATTTDNKDAAAATTTTTATTRPARRRNTRRQNKSSDKNDTTAPTTTESKDDTTTETAASPSTATTSSAKSKRPKRERKPAANTADRQQSSTTLFVRNIPYSFDDAKLLETFKDFSPKSAHVIVNKHSSRSKGFGFVEFDDAANQQKGLALHKHKVEDRELSVKVALIPEHTPDTATTTA